MPWRRRVVRPPDETLVAPARPVAPPGPPGPPPEPMPPPPREWWPWMLALLILVLAGLLAGWLLTRDDNKNDNETTTVAITRSTDTETGATTETTTTTTQAKVAVAGVVGQRSAQAVETLRAQGLKAVIASVFSEQPSGVVVAQNPKPDTQVNRGSSVRLNVSKGSQNVAVPNVVGTAEAAAVDQLRQAGFQVNTFDVPAAEAKGTVVAQSPAAGGQAKSGSSVRVNVSTGNAQGQTTQRPPGPPPPPSPPPSPTPPPPPPPPPPPATTTTPATVTVPDLVGQNRKTAADQIRSLGLKVTIRYVPSEEAVGNVVSQSPAAGTTRKRGEGVLINLSFGPGGDETAKAVPDVLGKDQQTATSTLEGAGFVVEVLRQRVSSASQNGIVVDEQPGGGQKAPQGSTITITVGSTSG